MSYDDYKYTKVLERWFVRYFFLLRARYFRCLYSHHGRSTFAGMLFLGLGLGLDHKAEVLGLSLGTEGQVFGLGLGFGLVLAKDNSRTCKNVA